MTIEADLYDRLVAEVAAVGGRVFPVILPQEVEYPALTFKLVSDPRVHDLDGPTGLVEARYEVTAWSTSYLEAKDVSGAVRLALDGFSGILGVEEVSRLKHEGSIDLFDNVAKVHHTATDFVAKYAEV